MLSARYTSYRAEAARATRAERVARVPAVGAAKTWTTLRGTSIPYWGGAPGELSAFPVWYVQLSPYSGFKFYVARAGVT